MSESIKKVKDYLSLSENIYKLINKSPGIADNVNLTCRGFFDFFYDHSYAPADLHVAKCLGEK